MSNRNAKEITVRYRIATDYECNPEEWWAALADHGGGAFAEPINELIRNDVLVVDQDQRDQLVSHFSSLPGWHTGQPHAPHPVTVTEIAEPS